jgi:hypothetical protein
MDARGRHRHGHRRDSAANARAAPRTAECLQLVDGLIQRMVIVPYMMWIFTVALRLLGEVRLG